MSESLVCGLEALFNEAWQTSMWRLYSMRPDIEALPGEFLVDVDVEVLFNEAWFHVCVEAMPALSHKGRSDEDRGL